MNIYKLVTSFFLILVFSSSLVFAESNGVWHDAADVRGGVFGSDEGTQEFYFLNRVGINTQTPAYDLSINGESSIKKIYDYDNNLFFLDLNGNSNLKDLSFEILTGLTINAQDIIVSNSLSTNTFIADTIQADVQISSPIYIDLDNAGFYLNPNGNSMLARIYATADIRSQIYYDYSGGTSYFLDITGNSNLKDVDFDSVTINGQTLNDLYINEGQANSITSSMIVDSTITIDDLGANSVGASELVSSYESGSAYDSRFINTNGDTMSGDLNMGNNQILGISTLNTGQGANELFDMNQNVLTTSTVTFNTLNTGQGANELYDMNQNVLSTSNVVFNNVNSNGILYVNEIRPQSGNSVTIRLN